MSFIDSLYDMNYVYEAHDLGTHYSATSTLFKLWAPLASLVEVALYYNGYSTNSSSLLFKQALLKDDQGIWSLEIGGNLNAYYYTYFITHNGQTVETVDPYAKAVGVNGLRGMILDFSTSNPLGWGKDQPVSCLSPVDAVLYELHVRDLSVHPSSGITHKGKFLAFTEKDTKNKDGLPTGISHLKSLGITHVHLLPIYDFNSVDETQLDTPLFNWGYDPQNYNALEGSYATDPYDGSVRIKEFKKLVMSLHHQGIGVIMDVVYNHTALTENSCLNLTVPHYYYRQNAIGDFNDGSDCGNEIASERPMVRKFIIESLLHWAKEYHLDGFRFDLMGILDIETMNLIRMELVKINPDIILYGEGWTASETMLAPEASAVKSNTPKLDSRIACFSDDMRDAIKGHVFYEEKAGFVNGNKELSESIKFGIVGATKHSDVDYSQINYSSTWWAKSPTQTITYCEAHDNLTLFDKLQLTCPQASIEELIVMHKMSATLVLTSQGIPFLHAGQEFLRTKINLNGTLEHNSYKSPDFVNQLDWDRKTEYIDVFNYYKCLIELRKAHPAFRMRDTQSIQKHLTFLQGDMPNFVGYVIANYDLDSWQSICVLFNPNDYPVTVALPADNWTMVVNTEQVGLSELGKVTCSVFTLPSHTHFVLVDTSSYLSSLT